MANTYTQIHLHIIFAVKNRESLIYTTFKEELYKYISGIIQHNGHKLLIINGMPDHTHMLIGLSPSQSLSDLMKELKQQSSKWVNEKGFLKGHFAWQSGYGAFSYAKSQLPTVIDYIKNQENHHEKKSFKEEYLSLLKTREMDFIENYIFEEVL